MRSNHLWKEPFGAILTAASPASASAFDSGKNAFETELVQRTNRSDGIQNQAQASSSGTHSIVPEYDRIARHPGALRTWIRTLIQRIDTWSWQAEMREFEAYLAQAQNIADLEDRIRRYDQPTLARGRALR
jgi:hypothetical protein